MPRSVINSLVSRCRFSKLKAPARIPLHEKSVSGAFMIMPRLRIFPMGLASALKALPIPSLPKKALTLSLRGMTPRSLKADLFFHSGRCVHCVGCFLYVSLSTPYKFG